MKKSNTHTFVVLAYKESKDLERCINSVLNQSVKTNVVIATSTPNKYIERIAKKYKLDIITNNSKEKGIGIDFDFATNCVKSKLVTVAHQDDIYDYNYAEEVINLYNKYPDSLIIFTDYYEIKNGNKVFSNLNLKIKRILLFLLRFHKISNYKFIKRSAIRFGNGISCPAVTYVQENVPKTKFDVKMKCDIDWYAWEKLSKLDGRFIYSPKKLMGHTISDETTTTEIINNGIRTKEDYEILKKFWPSWIAKIIAKLYKNSEKNNNIN